MLSRLKLIDLLGIAGMVGIAGAGTSLVLVNKSRTKVMKEEYCTKAFRVLSQNSAAMDLIGGFPKIYRIDLSDSINNQLGELSTKLKVPFKGSKKSGHLFVWANRQHKDSQWDIKRLEIILDDISDKKIIVYKTDENI